MRALIGIAGLALGACAIVAPLTPGVSREADVRARFGAPAEQRQLPDGSRVLEFPREPEGHENWRVIVDSNGSVRSVEQVIDEPYFAKVLPGMSKAEVLQLLGRPSEEKSYALSAEDVVSWRYLEFGARSMFFNAHFDPSGRLKYSSRSVDPLYSSQGTNDM